MIGPLFAFIIAASAFTAVVAGVLAVWRRSHRDGLPWPSDPNPPQPPQNPSDPDEEASP